MWRMVYISSVISAVQLSLIGACQLKKVMRVTCLKRYWMTNMIILIRLMSSPWELLFMSLLEAHHCRNQALFFWIWGMENCLSFLVIPCNFRTYSRYNILCASVLGCFQTFFLEQNWPYSMYDCKSARSSIGLGSLDPMGWPCGIGYEYWQPTNPVFEPTEAYGSKSGNFLDIICSIHKR